MQPVSDLNLLVDTYDKQVTNASSLIVCKNMNGSNENFVFLFDTIVIKIYLLNQGPEETPSKGKRFFIDVMCDDLGPKVEELGGKITKTRALADYVIVPDATKPGLRNELSMVLKGGCLVGSAALKTTVGDLGGCARTAFKSPMDQPKWICMTVRFKQLFGGVAAIIEQSLAAQSKPRQWKTLSHDDMIVWLPVFRVNLTILATLPLPETKVKNS